MSFRFTSVADFGLVAAAEILTRGFADYFVAIPFTPTVLLTMGRVDSVDLTLSRVVFRDDQPAGVALIARRGWTTRVAGMAFLPEARRRGCGRALMDHLTEEANGRGDHSIVLEVIEQNEPALRLYQQNGFATVRRLVGFRANPGSAGKSDDGVKDVDVRTMGAAVMAGGCLDWPWQLSGETLAQLGPPTVAYRRGTAWLACTPMPGPRVGIRGLVVAENEAGRDEAVCLLRAAQGRYPGAEWKIPALWPEERADVFLRAGYSRDVLCQLQLERRLT